MEEEKKSKSDSSRYFDELLLRIREIRSSERNASAKIWDVIATTIDYDVSNGRNMFLRYKKTLDEPDYRERLANLLLLHAEAQAMNQNAMSMADVEKLLHSFISHDNFKQDIYDYPSYQGVYDKDDEGDEISLPEELQNFKGSSMVLKLEEFERFIDTFCSRNTYYKRAYAILAELDKEVLDCVEMGSFPRWILIPYKDEGDAIFEFSHFECDLREPDKKYRTLYVVYRYDTTVS